MKLIFAMAVWSGLTLSVPGQVTLLLGDSTGTPTTTSPHPFTLPNTLTLRVQAPSLPGALGVSLLDVGITGSNPMMQLVPGLILNVGPGFVPLGTFALDSSGSNTQNIPLLLTVPPAVGVLSLFWQTVVVNGSPPLGIALSNPIEAPIVAGTPVWRKLNTASTPPGRSSAGALFDPVGRRLIISHGSPGVGGSVLQDTWSFSAAGTPTWSNLAPGGTIPAARWGNSLVYDSVGQRLILHAGSINGFRPSNDVHTISLRSGAAATWSRLSPTGTPPPGRRSHTAVFDAVSNRMIVFGGGTGFSPGQASLGDLWALDFTVSAHGTWLKLNLAGPPAQREVHAAVYDAPNNRMIVYGGVAQGGASLGDVWTLGLTPGSEAWGRLVPGGISPQARNSHSAVYDGPNHRMVVYGGIVGNANTTAVLALMLARGVERWQTLLPAGTAPQARDSHMAAFDPVGRRMIIHSGFAMFPSTPFQDTWVLDLP